MPDHLLAQVSRALTPSTRHEASPRSSWTVSVFCGLSPWPESLEQ